MGELFQKCTTYSNYNIPIRPFGMVSGVNAARKCAYIDYDQFFGVSCGARVTTLATSQDVALTFSAIFGFFSFGVKEYLSRELVKLA